MEREIKIHEALECPGQRWWTADEDRRVLRKLDLHVMPLMFCCFMFSFLDRGNIGNAKTSMVRDLGLSDHQFVWLLQVFYISFVGFQFLLVSYSLIPPRKYVATCVGVWGLCSALQVAGQQWAHMMALRFFLGAAEAGFSTGAAYYFSTLYPRREVGFRFSLYISAGPFASSWSGTLAYALMKHSPRLAGWRALFLVEGLLTMSFAPIVWFALPNMTSTAWFLNERERKIATARVLNDNFLDGGDDQGVERQKDEHGQPVSGQQDGKGVITSYRHLFNLSDGLQALRYPLSYISAALFFFDSMALSSFTAYLPTILEGFGHSTATSQGYSVPPYLSAFASSLLAAWFCDRFGFRGLVSGCLMAVGGTGYVLLALVDSVGVRYFASFLVAIALCTSPPLIYSWTIANQFSHSRRGAALVILSTLGQSGPFVGTRLFPAREGPRYQRGMAICASVLFAGFLLSLATALWMKVQNAQRERRAPLLNHKKAPSQAERDERERDLSRRGMDSVYFRWEY